MKDIKLCIFDMDGLLIDSERCVWSKGEKLVGKQLGVEITDDFISTIIGVSHSRCIKMLKDKFGEDFDGELFMKKNIEYYENYCRNNIIPLRPGALELLQFLKNNNILISLGTSTEKELAYIALSKNNILQYFDFTVYGDEVVNGKPNPEIFLKSVEHFNLKPEECIVFEDSQSGAKAAYDGKINLILVPDVKQASDLDKEKAFAIIDSLEKAIPIITKINNIN